MLFQELAEVSKYDGIWACSSILHLPIDELAEVMKKMVVALKEHGIIYTWSCRLITIFDRISAKNNSPHKEAVNFSVSLN